MAVACLNGPHGTLQQRTDPCRKACCEYRLLHDARETSAETTRGLGHDCQVACSARMWTHSLRERKTFARGDVVTLSNHGGISSKAH